MKDTLIMSLGAIAIIAIMAGSLWWTIYKYHDCLRVGHTKLYCVMDIGS